MAILGHKGESEFPFSKKTVFDAICKALPAIDGMKVDSSDKLSGRIIVTTLVTFWSSGEYVAIQLTSLTATNTKILITSTSKTILDAIFNMRKNRQNIDKILFETSKILSALQPKE